MPIDINSLRTYKGGNPDKYRTYMQQRYKDPKIVDDVLTKDEAWRTLRGDIDTARTNLNKLSKSTLLNLIPRNRRI